MIVFLEKVRIKTIFSIFDPVRVEPLELCYLKALLNDMDIESYIVDRMFGFTPPKGLVPDLVVLTGYNTAENEIIRIAGAYKKKYPHVKVIAGGVHVQENAESFRVEAIDFVFHSGSLKTFKTLLEKIKRNDRIPLKHGVDSRCEDGWHLGARESIYVNDDIRPDRNFFYAAKSKLRYLDKGNIALVKSSVGCPYKCSFCYCRLLNDKRFIPADYEKMIEEMESIDADYYWVVESILKFQRKFFDEGKEALRPLVLKDVADDIGMHESTISRATNGKYVQTPRGLFELKYFFASSVSEKDGDGVSSTSVKSIIQKLIDEESPQKHLRGRSKLWFLIYLLHLQTCPQSFHRYPNPSSHQEFYPHLP
jgi:hypothetical protein